MVSISDFISPSGAGEELSSLFFAPLFILMPHGPHGDNITRLPIVKNGSN